ncbi:MAG: PKD domain-containing protein, partial [Methanoregula sp.]|nr:PKD domain-containing protein [Methanoregula sp.]
KAFSDPTLFTEAVDATAKRTGSYGWHAHGVITSGNDQQSNISRYQVIDLTGMTTVSVWINFSGTHAGDGIAYLDVYVYDVGETLPPLSVGTGDNGFTSGWARLDIDVTGYYAGNCEIQIRKVVANTTGGTVNAQFYVDDIVCNALPPAPTASFTADVTSGDPPLTVQFTDTSTGTPTSWSWDFDDGSDPSTDQNPEHIFSGPGTFHVVLTATNAGGSDASDAMTITVGIAPVASFTYVRAGNVITFTDTSTHVPTSWSWDF